MKCFIENFTILLVLNVGMVLGMDPVTKDLATPRREYGEACGYESCPPVQPGKLNVHLVPHTHAELGYTRTFYQHYTGYDDYYDKSDVNMKRTLDYTITELWSNRERKFTLAAMPYFFHWWANRDGTVRRMVYQLLRQGRLHLVGGSWGMPDEATTSYHAIIDLFTYSLRKLNATFLECGRPLVAWQADVFGHSREFASLAAQMGFDGLFVNPIGFDDEVLRMKTKRQALEFLWRGSDDIGAQTDMFSHKLFDGYWPPPGFCFSSTCDDPLLVTSDSLFRNTEERADAFLESVLHRQAPSYNTSHALVLMGQRDGYFDAPMWFSNIDTLIKVANERGYKRTKKVHVMYSTPSCYLKAVHEANPELETKQDDFFPFAYDKHSYVAGMYTSRPSLKLLAREGHVYLQMAKQLQVLAKLWNNDKKFEEMQWTMGAFQDHNIITGAMRQHVKDYYVHKMYVAIQQSTLILKQALNKLRNSPSGTIYYRCSFNTSVCPNSNHKEFFIVIYNPLTWTVTVPVRLPIRRRQYTVLDPRGRTVEAAIMKVAYPILGLPFRNTKTEHELVFMAENVPPLGYRSYYFQFEYNIAKRSKRTHEKPIKETEISNKTLDAADMNLNTVRRSKEITELFTNPIKITKRPKRTSNVNTNKFKVSKKFRRIDEVFTNQSKITKRQKRTAATAYKKSLIKILKKRMNKKYLSKQTDPKLPEQSILDVLDQSDYDFFEETTTNEDLEPKSEKDREIEEVFKDEAVTMNEDYSEIKVTTEALTGIATSAEINDTFTEDVASTNGFNETDFVNEEERKTKPIRTTTEDFETTIVYKFSKDETVKEADNMNAVQESRRRKGKDKMNSTNEIVDDNNVNLVKKPTKTLYVPVASKNRPKIHEIPEVGNTETPKDESDTFKVKSSKDSYDYEESSDLYVKNQYIRINLDPSSKKVVNITLSNGVSVLLDMQFYFYASDFPGSNKRVPGVYIFRSVDNIPRPILDYLDVQVYKNSIVEEVHYIYSDYASLVLRLYVDSPVVEVDWMVGPIPITDGVGKEVFLRYTSDLSHGGVFYTDSNGRQMLKRIRNARPLYEHVNKDPVAGNYYPVTSKMYIEDVDKNIRLSIFPDRAAGGASLRDGEIEMMLHRRILTDDSGIGAWVNDTDVVRGKHYLYITKADYKPNKIFEKKFAKELELKPQTLISSGKPYGKHSKSIWLEHVNEFSFLRKKLPIGVHVLTTELWNDNTLLLRLENYLEKSDTIRSGIKQVFLTDLFVNIRINHIRETTLAANVWLKDFNQMQWKKKQKFVENFNNLYGSDTAETVYAYDDVIAHEEVVLEKGVTLSPQQIRTFVCLFDYI